MTETLLFMLFIWIIGWLYACGVHKQAADKVEKLEVNKYAAYAVLFIGWAHYLGYGKDG